jgi:hypothetical protein
VITSTGTAMGPGKTVTYKGTCVVHDDPDTKAWFYPALAWIHRSATMSEVVGSG